MRKHAASIAVLVYVPTLIATTTARHPNSKHRLSSLAYFRHSSANPAYQYTYKYILVVRLAGCNLAHGMLGLHLDCNLGAVVGVGVPPHHPDCVLDGQQQG